MTTSTLTVEPAARPVPRAAPLGDRVAIRQLAVVEGRRMVRHPLFLAGCGLTAAYFLNTSSEPNAAFQGLTGAGAMGPAMGTMLAANLAALRARTSGAEEVLGVTALPPAARTLALVLALVQPVLATALLLAGAGLAVEVWDGVPVATPAGVVPVQPTAVELLQGPLFVAAAGALGLLLARWVPSRLASAVVAIAYFALLLPTYFWGVISSWRYLLPLADHSRIVGWVQVDAGSGYHVVDGFDVVGMAWHLAYLGGLTALLSALAVLAHGWRRPVGALAVAASAVTIATAAVQVS